MAKEAFGLPCRLSFPRERGQDVVEDIEVHLWNDMPSGHGGSIYRFHIDARMIPVNL